MTELPTGQQEILEIVAHYSDTLDLVEAEQNAHAKLIEVLTEGYVFQPIMLKIVMEQSLQARLDMLTSLVVQALADAGGWPVHQYDQERKALRDAMRLVKHHVEIGLLEGFMEYGLVDYDDERGLARLRQATSQAEGTAPGYDPGHVHAPRLHGRKGGVRLALDEPEATALLGTS